MPEPDERTQEPVTNSPSSTWLHGLSPLPPHRPHCRSSMPLAAAVKKRTEKLDIPTHKRPQGTMIKTLISCVSCVSCASCVAGTISRLEKSGPSQPIVEPGHAGRVKANKRPHSELRSLYYASTRLGAYRDNLAVSSFYLERH